ncbi:hypothetical protein ACLOJK_016368 [Asimina triloba]
MFRAVPLGFLFFRLPTRPHPCPQHSCAVSFLVVDLLPSPFILTSRHPPPVFLSLSSNPHPSVLSCIVSPPSPIKFSVLPCRPPSDPASSPIYVLYFDTASSSLPLPSVSNSDRTAPPLQLCLPVVPVIPAPPGPPLQLHISTQMSLACYRY